MTKTPEMGEVNKHYFQREPDSYINRDHKLYMSTHFEDTFCRNVSEVILPEGVVLSQTEEKVRSWLKSVVERDNPGLPAILGRDLIHKPLHNLSEDPIGAFIAHLSSQLGLPASIHKFSAVANRLATNSDVLFIIMGKDLLQTPAKKTESLGSKIVGKLSGNYIPNYQTLKAKLSTLGTVIDE